MNAAGGDSSGPPTASDDCIAELLSGNVTITSGSTCKSFNCTSGTGDYAGILTHTANTWTIAGNLVFSAGMSYLGSGGFISVALTAGPSITTNGQLIGIIQNTNSGTMTLNDNISFVAAKTGSIILNGPLNVNGKTISGNSATNRVLFRSTTLGTSATVTVASGTFANADFRDITFSNGGNNLDLSAITGLSGDCGGNSNATGGKVVTFTTAATQTWSGTSGGNWSANAWTSRVPLPQDDVTINAAFSATQTVTNDMPRMGASISWTGATGSPNFTMNTANQTIYGSLILISGITTFTASQATNFEGRGNFNLDSGGKSFGAAVVFQMIGGKITLLSAFTQTVSNTGMTNGTIDANGFNMTIVALNGNNSNTKALVTGNATITLTNSSGTPWNLSAVGTTLTMTGSTILFSDTGASSKTFAGAGFTYNNLSISGGGAGAVIITGSNTFANLPQVTGGTKTITITAGTTQTFTGGTNFGNGSNVVTINTGGAAATFTKPSGAVINATSISLTSIVATETNKWYAGPTPPSVDGGGNTNWIFLAAPSGASGFGRGRFGQNRFGGLPFGTQAFHG